MGVRCHLGSRDRGMGLFSAEPPLIAPGCGRELVEAFAVCSGLHHPSLRGGAPVWRLIEVLIFLAGVLVGLGLVPTAFSIGKVRKLSHSLCVCGCCSTRQRGGRSRFDDDSWVADEYDMTSLGSWGPPVREVQGRRRSTWETRYREDPW